MVSAIGSSPFSGPAGTGPSVAGLQAQLDRCQQQLSDNVNCASANTREGRATIQALSDKISEIKARIREADTGTPPSANRAAPAASGSTLTTLGTRLDVFA